eukprot:265731-Prymnesium_polylepis.1
MTRCTSSASRDTYSLKCSYSPAETTSERGAPSSSTPMASELVDLIVKAVEPWQARASGRVTRRRSVCVKG